MGRAINLYVNGVATDAGKAQTQANRISGMIGEEVESFHNETGGLLSDSIQVLDGWLTGSTQESDKLKVRLEQLIRPKSYELDNKGKTPLLIENGSIDTIRIFCHSQGGLITANAINLFDNEDENEPNYIGYRKLFRVYAFASAQNHMPSGCGHYEFFFNRFDFLYDFHNGNYEENWGQHYIRIPEIEVDLNFDGADADTEFAGYILPDNIAEHDFLNSYLDKYSEFENYKKSEFYRLLQSPSPLEKSQYAKNRFIQASSSMALEDDESNEASDENPNTENILSFEPGEFGERITAFKDHPLFNCGAIPIDFKTKEIYDLVASGEAFYNKVSSSIDEVKNEVQPVIDLLTSGNLTLDSWTITPPASWTGIGGTAQDITSILGQTTSLLESADEFKKMVEDFEIHTNILSGVDLVPEDKSGLYSLFTTAVSWNMGSRSFGDQTDKLEKVFGSLFNGEAVMGAIKSTSEAIRTATDAVDLINNIQNGTSTPTEILDELSQIGIFSDEIAQVKELINLDELALKEAKEFFNISGLARQLSNIYRNPCSASLPQDVFGTDPLKILL
jgi:hypothetical protein